METSLLQFRLTLYRNALQRHILDKAGLSYHIGLIVLYTLIHFKLPVEQVSISGKDPLRFAIIRPIFMFRYSRDMTRKQGKQHVFRVNMTKIINIGPTILFYRTKLTSLYIWKFKVRGRGLLGVGARPSGVGAQPS